MNLYVLIKTERAAQMSEGIYRLMQPPHLRSSRHVGTHFCDWRDRGDGWSVLILPSDVMVPIHSQADGELLVEVLTDAVEDGSITVEEVQGIATAMGQYAGQRVPVLSFIPPSWANQPGAVMTEAQARAAGFLPELEASIP